MLLEGIETLLVLSREKTMSRTGSQLYISQSAVSKRIANLEKKIGKKLIEPSGRHIKLTSDALALIATIEPTFNELIGQIHDQQVIEDTSLIKLDCSETLVAGYLSLIMEERFSDDPYLRISTNHTPRIIENVKSGKATLGFCAGYLPPHHGLMSFHLADEPFSIISKHPLTTLPTAVVTNDLSNPANTYQQAILSKHNIEPIMEMDSYTAAAQLALAGMAPALIPKSIINTLKIDEKYRFEFDQLAHLIRPIHVCLRHNTYRNQRVKTLIESIADVVAKEVLVPSTSTW
ncbi:LysR family transcriptional regulator [Vibrio sp. J1-1]|uniref:LysR family transcriptional regulator n=1 Tax=Gammaproteobacteria TaxID=1236 RepID=UPI001F3C8C1A|nr:LysR family transcriptional regulator [Vibrio sp. J1-1]MBR9873851.1 LysR family transcriptional regulator [Vibrionaceae bacterium]MCF7483251.1 LysR family transcriptional regulator [Vibrio sp. J1-1]